MSDHKQHKQDAPNSRQAQHEHEHGHDHGHGHSHDHDEHQEHRKGTRIRWGVAISALVIYCLSGIRVVGPAQRGIQQRLGKVISEHIRSGVHFGFPVGIDRLTLLEMQKARRIGIGIDATDRLLGNLPDPGRSQFMSGNRNIVDIQLSVQYVVREPKAFLFATTDAPGTVRRACESALCEVVGKMPIDDILTTGKAEVQLRVRDMAQTILDRHGAGVTIISVTQEKASPPERVADAFREVTNARADRGRMVAEAEGYREDLLPRARGEAATIRQQAKATAYETRKVAEGEADRFSRILSEAGEARGITRHRLHAETMEEILPRTRKILVGPESADDLRVMQETP